MTGIDQALQNALQLANSDQLDSARQACQQILLLSPQHADALNLLQQIEFRLHMTAAQQRFPGRLYLEWLEWFHLVRQPTTYLEIGVETGNSIRLAKPPTKVIGIDPEFNIVYTQQTWNKLFRETSNDFFATHDLREVMQADAIDLAFIDGLHTFDQTLTDFINVERYSDENSLTIFHDIFPVSPITASRERKSVLWLGDTWKVILILRQYRPDLQLFTIPTYPSGLAVVANLDCHSTILSDCYAEIVEKFMALTFEEHQASFESQLNLVPNDFQAVEKILKR